MLTSGKNQSTGTKIKPMKPKKVLFISTLAGVVLVAPADMAVAQSELITFDDLPFTYSIAGDAISNGYAGLEWNNFSLLDTAYDYAHFGLSGYYYSPISPSNVALNGHGNAAMISDGTFDLNSAYLTAAWNDGLRVEVQGFVGTTLAYDNTYTLSATSPTLINFNYLGIDEVNFISSGGKPHGYTSGAGTQFAMDNLSVTLVPEPTALALIGLGGLTLLRFHRRK